MNFFQKLGIDGSLGGDCFSFKVLIMLIRQLLNKLARVELLVINLFFLSELYY